MATLTTRIDRMKAEIQQIQTKIDELERFDGVDKAGNYISDRAKIQAFDALLKQTYQHVAFIVEHGYAQKDSKGYIYETAMESTLGPKIWDFMNRHLK